MPFSTTDPNSPIVHQDWRYLGGNPKMFEPDPVDYERIREIIHEEIINALRIPKEYWELLDENTLFVPPSARR